MQASVQVEQNRGKVTGIEAGTISISIGQLTIPSSVDTRSDQPDRPPVVVVGALPPDPPNFVGRTDLLDQLHQQLTTSRRPTAIVAAHGLGGVGKTALAVAYAYQHHTNYQLIGWIPAETPLTTAAGLAALAQPLGVTVAPDQDQTIAAVLTELRHRDRWLLLFDNADNPTDLIGCLPTGGRGHIVITSRNPAWADLAHPLQVEVLDPDAAVELLMARTGEQDRAAAAELAEALGWLPLALQQASAYITATPGCTLAGYLTRYHKVRTILLAENPPVGYPASVATTWQVNLDTLSDQDPAAVQLLSLCAFLAPDAIPLALLTAEPAVLPDELRAAVARPLGIDGPLRSLHRFSLVGRDPGGIRVHRLVQAVTRDHLGAQQAAGWAELAALLLWAVFPTAPDEPETWPKAAALLPHVVPATEHAGPASLVVANLLNGVGAYLTRRTQLHAARQSLERALRIQEQIHGPNHNDVAITLNNLGVVLRDLGDLAAARQTLQRALHIKEQVYGPNHDDVAITLTNLGLVLHASGELPAARQTLRRALNILEQLHGPDHHEVATALTALGSVLQALGELPAARQTLQRALNILEQLYGPDHRQVALTLVYLSYVLRDLEELPDALRTLERALHISEQLHGPIHHEVATTLASLGYVQRHMGELHSARQNLERALHIFEQVFGPDHHDVARTLTLLSFVLVALGELSAAHHQIERAVGIFRARFGVDHPATQDAERLLGVLSD